MSTRRNFVVVAAGVVVVALMLVIQFQSASHAQVVARFEKEIASFSHTVVVMKQEAEYAAGVHKNVTEGLKATHQAVTRSYERRLETMAHGYEAALKNSTTYQNFFESELRLLRASVVESFDDLRQLCPREREPDAKLPNFNVHPPFPFVADNWSILDSTIKFEEMGFMSLRNMLDVVSSAVSLHNFIVNVGAGDGISGEPTYALFGPAGFGGVAIEPRRTGGMSYEQLLTNLPWDRITKLNTILSPENLDSVLGPITTMPKDPDLFKQDIDSYDCDLARAVLKRYRPKVYVMEINEKIPWPIEFEVRFLLTGFRRSNGHVYGCSVASAFELMRRNGYTALQVVGNDAYFVDGKFGPLFGNHLRHPGTLLRLGYFDNQPIRHWYPWNEDVAQWFEKPLSQDAVALLKAVDDHVFHLDEYKTYQMNEGTDWVHVGIDPCYYDGDVPRTRPTPTASAVPKSASATMTPRPSTMTRRNMTASVAST